MSGTRNSGVLRRAWRLHVFGALVCASIVAAFLFAQSARSAPAADQITVAAAEPVYLVDSGRTATVRVTMTTGNGQPLDHAVAVHYATGALSRMSLAEKIGQMTQADRYMFTDTPTTSNTTPNDLRAWFVGSLLSGGGDTPTPNSPTGWANMVGGFQARALTTPLQIPLVYGEDTVHGDGNMIGATAQHRDGHDSGSAARPPSWPSPATSRRRR